MNAQSVGATRYIGERTPRKEDARLLTGRGQYTDDVRLPGMLHVAYARSAVARGTIVSIDTAAARDLPGVHAIYLQRDFAPVPLYMMNFFFGPIESPVTLLADGRVACVGDPVAMVIADSRAIAEDAASLIEIVIDEEPPVVTLADARTGPLVHPGMDSNVAAEMGEPEIDEDLQARIDGAAYKVTRTIRHQRIAQSPMEARACVASPDGAEELTIYISCQSPNLVCRYVSVALGLPQEAIRVIAKDVGGGFGLKNMPWREELAVIVAARLFGRPLKWIEDRFESLTASSHAREQEITLTVGFDHDGRLVAGHCDYNSNNGAWPMGEDCNVAVHMFMWPAHKMPAYGFISRGWYSNTMGLGGYRGPWAIESLMRETLLEAAAREIGIDTIELRRRNLIYAADQPATSTLGIEVTDITPGECLEKLVAHLDVAKFRQEQAAARKQGRYLGLGFATYVEPTASAGTMAPMTGETANIRIDPTGKVIASLTTHSQGHGTATTMAQVIADRLGVAYEDVTVFEGDSAWGGFSPGAAGSRQGVIGGGASWKAAEMLADKVKSLAAHLFNANPEAITIENGTVHVAGAPEMSRSLREIAEVAYAEPHRLPAGLATGLEAQFRYQPPPITFTSAAHACMVEVDAETGFVKILRWISSEDCGTVINPGVVEGQIAGGLAQAIGQVLLEDMPYDARGNPLAATFKDYLMPAISDVPDFEYIHANTPSQTIGGMRGVGEGGAIVGPPTLVNAIQDALAPFGEVEMNLPLTPAKILDVIEGRDISGTSSKYAAERTAPEAPPAPASAAMAEPAAPQSAAATPATPDGDWAVTMKPPMGPAQQMTAHFETAGDALSGYLKSPEGQQGFTGTVEGNRLKFDLHVEKPIKITLKYDLAITGDTLTGKAKMGMMGSAKVSGERI
ncbi:xanthine dehydrogenase family protein molybdopterin-binding subunit [Novosphingobium album (ex Liu et al. 2023)]|uniref:Xanthine dehydrogenase family protein molybdopterin-binding subunit n=1 Tax=Novosphingobium album (ex Liu et al. 2023) TaxID=3031130 RepID=A0ABT5WSU5_9SPHN|nr:xanthine dehydrogenase family protein molybdopterin-binding subunit [Novosphingobium album (ex Liu et al. 2023)]MDE8653110.1 xanthine dehydrogenase family protein molybdopterin-binding subunit [Novosphingobium album (ex Liu et al. 2023)]